MNEHEFAELSAAAALHALSPDDERRFRSALTVHPEWRAIVAADAETAAALGLPVAEVTPPDSIRSSLLSAIADPERGDRAEPAPSPSAASTPRRGGRRRMRLVFALAACLALVVAAGVGAVTLNHHLNRPAAVVALEQIEEAPDAQQASVEPDGGGTATAHWSASLGKAVLVTEGIATPGEGRVYELWFVRADAPVSAGTFSVDGGAATAELRGEMQAGDAIAVTVEQAGGSSTGQPTSDPVIVIPTT